MKVEDQKKNVSHLEKITANEKAKSAHFSKLLSSVEKEQKRALEKEIKIAQEEKEKLLPDIDQTEPKTEVKHCEISEQDAIHKYYGAEKSSGEQGVVRNLFPVDSTSEESLFDENEIDEEMLEAVRQAEEEYLKTQ